MKLDGVRAATFGAFVIPKTLNGQFCPLRRFCTGLPRSPASTLSEVIQHLQPTESDWDSEKLRGLIFADANPSSSSQIFNIAHRLGSSRKAWTFFQWIRANTENAQFVSRAFQAAAEVAGEEPNSSDVLVQLHGFLKESNLKLSASAVAVLGRSLKRAGMVDELCNVYSEIDPSLRSSQLCNHVIDGLLAGGRMSDARKMLDEMLKPDAEAVPNQYTADMVFGWALRSEDFWKHFVGSEIICLVKEFGRHGVFLNSFKLTKLIGKLCRSGKILVARDVLREVIEMGGCVEAAPCNTLLAAMDRKGMVREVNALMCVMKERGVQPNVVTFGIIINHLCKARRVDQALEVFDKLKNSGDNDVKVSVKPDVIIYNTLIDGLCKVGRVDDGCSLMNEMKCVPTTSTFNCLIDGFCKAGEIDRGLELFERMRVDGVSPNVITLNTLVDGLCRHERIGAAMEIFHEMQRTGLKADAVTYTTLITSFCNVGNVEAARELFDRMIDSGCKPDAIVYQAYLSGLTLCGKMAEASSVAAKMKEAGFSLDLASYNVLIGGFCRRKKIDEAYETLKEMERAGVKPDSVTYNTLISCFSKLGDFETAGIIMSRMSQEGLVPNVVTYGAVIHAFCESDRLDEAVKIFERMRVPPNTVIYNILIDGHCKTGNIETAASLMNEMRAGNLRPTTNTYNSLFKAFMEEQRLDKALNLMDQMIEDGCNPDLVTMKILSDWLSCAGESDRLRRFVQAFAVPASTG
uniref:Pentatricopeptide repeat-containing protein n=1 Tax=Kalanchoe fedtschenkoi TaxID=63787 RepID=A0A7N0T3I8_KALFE